MTDSSNIVTILTACGGLGIFLIGLITMTNGLQSLAGDKLRSTLLSFTKSAYSGAASGTVMTAILQSSSATTVTAVGFVSAGILTFTEALGIIFGANLGTTITGWLVAIFGFKLKLGIIVLPLIFIGALMKLFANQKLASTGLALAGFGLIFVGIGTMQEAMQGLHGIITPELLPGDTIMGRLQLILMGMIFTIITQSSSAGVATTLTMLYAGAINFPQAAALVIGMDIGTTVTAAMATIGGNINTRRTGFSHVIYNFITAIGAFLLITPFVSIWESTQNSRIVENAEIALVAFHTTFNLLGVILILPFANYFANFIKTIIKEDKSSYVSILDDTLLHDSKIALNMTLKTVIKEFISLLEYISFLLNENKIKANSNLEELQDALNKTHAFIDKIHLVGKTSKEWKYLVSMIHILDHLQRLHERCEEEEDRAITAKKTKHLKQSVQLLSKLTTNLINCIENRNWAKIEDETKDVYTKINENREQYRQEITQKIARGEIDIQEGSSQLEAIRWLRRVSLHIYRVSHHLNSAIIQSAK